MKKIFILLTALSGLCLSGFSQQIKASIGVGTTPNNVIIYLTPDATQTPATIGTLQFNIGISTASVTTPPTLAVVSSAFAGVTWAVTAPYSEGGYWNYNISTPSSPLQPNFTAGTEFQAMELTFSGGVPTVQDVSLVTLPDGGTTTTFALFLCTGTIQSDGSNLYYTRPSTVINNNFSYDITGNSAGSTTSTATIASIIVPVKFTGFSAVKKDDNALLNWAASNEGPTSDHYEIERSLNAVDYVNVVSVPVKGNGNFTSNSYSYSDNGISALKAGTIYYRIEQVDKAGKSVFTEVKAVNVASGVSVSAYPNPVKNTVSVTLNLVAASDVSVTLTDASGKQLQHLQLAGAKGINVNKINLAGYAPGSYLLKVNTGTEITTLPIVKE